MLEAVNPETVPVSVAMAVYNGEAYLDSQIESILDQSRAIFELIIADDNSSDQSVEVAQRWAQKDARVKVVRNQKNVGLVKNFLKALQHARGDLVCFSDQDDVWRKEKIATLASLLLKDPGNMLACSDLEICDEHLKTTHKSFWREAGIKARSGRIGELALLRNIIPGCSMMFRKEVRDLLVAVPAESSLMHDHLAFICASSLGGILYSKEPLVQYRQHSRNTIGAFHPSQWDRKLFEERLTREIGILRPLLSFNLEKIERFLNPRSQENVLSRLEFIRYALFLRPDTTVSKLLGIVECISPEIYQLLRQGFKSKRNI
jgi:glycosyltransferase involved in cell wall biosynthesis